MDSQVKEQEGVDLWSFVGKVDAICITTNGDVKKDGRAVMGRGCAQEAAQRWPYLPLQFGQLLRKCGNCIMPLGLILPTGQLVNGTPEHPAWKAKKELGGSYLISFPVKHHWNEEADLHLIHYSAQTLAFWAQYYSSVVLPRPGCGNGRLSWDTVKPVIASCLDDKFLVVSK